MSQIKKRMNRDFKKNAKKAIVKSVKKSFKAGKAKGASSRKGFMGAKVSKKSVLARGAAKAGRVYKMTAAHKKAISDALKGKKRR